jgi:hypothetical protein
MSIIRFHPSSVPSIVGSIQPKLAAQLELELPPSIGSVIGSIHHWFHPSSVPSIAGSIQHKPVGQL